MKPYQRTRNLYDPASPTPFRLSRSRLENFINCPRCFYLDRRLGVEPPPIPSFTLNSAVDELLKKEFDGYRRLAQPHPMFKDARIDAIPFAHPMLDTWREVFKGIQSLHEPTNLLIFGAVDDLWINPKNEVIVVDYKATSTNQAISLDSEYRQAYKRQMEIYQWLLRRQKLKVSDTGYFVYCNADKSKSAFNQRLEFSIEIMPYEGRGEWVEGAIVAAHNCLKSDHLPDYSLHCPYCNYRQSSGRLEDVSSSVSTASKPFSLGLDRQTSPAFFSHSQSSSRKKEKSPAVKSELQSELF